MRHPFELGAVRREEEQPKASGREATEELLEFSTALAANEDERTIDEEGGEDKLLFRLLLI